MNRTLGGFAQNADEAYGAGARLAKDPARLTHGQTGAVDQILVTMPLATSQGATSIWITSDSVKAANDALDAGQFGHYLPAQIRNLLNDVSTGTVPLNVNTAVQIDSVLLPLLLRRAASRTHGYQSGAQCCKAHSQRRLRARCVGRLTQPDRWLQSDLAFTERFQRSKRRQTERCRQTTL